MAVTNYRDLLAWQRAIDLCVEIYRLTASFPPAEAFGVTSQMRRAAVSVASNIAEGSGRRTSKDLLNFLSHSRGSLKETESLLYVAGRLSLCDPERCERAFGLADETSRL